MSAREDRGGVGSSEPRRRRSRPAPEAGKEGVYDTDDMPERWQGVFEEMEENLHP